MMLISREDLKVILARLDAVIEKQSDLLLVGGSAVLVLSRESVATKDLDAFPTDTLENLVRALREAEKDSSKIDLNTSSAGFETFLPEDWQDRIRYSDEFSTKNIRVSTPSPEDLAVMKVFRYVAKDADDIERLSQTEGFNPDIFHDLFIETLPAAIGDVRRHAMSFRLAWNALYPDRAIEIDDILARCGL